MRLQGKIAIVTGAAGGIGEGIAKAYAAEGATVLACDLNEDGAAETAEAINKEGGKASSCHIDITDAEAAQSVIAKYASEHGKLDIIANVAGTGQRHSFLEAKIEEFDRVMKVNLMGTFICAVRPPPVKWSSKAMAGSSILRQSQGPAPGPAARRTARQNQRSSG